MVVVVQANRDHFHRWMATHGKTYGDETEKAMRYEHWLRSYAVVTKHQEEQENNNQQHPYHLKLNEFSDRSPEEWQKQRMGHKIISPNIWEWEWEEMLGKHKASGKNLPLSVDWRYVDGNPMGIVAVSPVKNQAQCE